MMIDIDNRSLNRLKPTNSINRNQMILPIKNISLASLTKKKLPHKSLSSIYHKSVINENIQISKYSESFISNSNISKPEKTSSNKDFNKQSSIYSNDHLDSSSSIDNLTIEFRQRTQLTYLLSLDFVQSSANFIYPNLRIISSGYFFHRNNHIEKNVLYMYSNTLISNKTLPLVFLGSEYFLRKPINFERLKFPLSTNENLEPLIDLFINRPQFIQEIPELNDLSNYLFLPQSISALLFFDSSLNQSARHLCYELRTKENQNKFTIKDLLYMSQRENNIIQMNALNDKRYHEFKNQLTDIYYYENSLVSFKQKQIKLNFFEKNIKTKSSITRSSLHKYSRIKTRPTIVTSMLS
ncbi:unnamed protein product [Rotaria sordida]|uniref:Uncharacterized protein n=1 Tax=Rotaria sordida TaxID=392033 RepID=A0A814XE66_9BILA|nr:unnamed protein product [Rotaria sordida]CAF1253057.1 unnamed protein product [Rotaria sordida]